MAKIILPGLIDPHVHLRDPGQTEKEDFYTGTCAALAGGYATVLDMPNNKTPITTLERLEEKIKIAKEKIVCDIGFYFGSLGYNLEEIKKISNQAFGVKLYLNETTGNFLIDKETLSQVFSTIPDRLTILVHAEESTLQTVIDLVRKFRKQTHVCHISLESELEQIIKAKTDGVPITCGVTPHHLFLTENDLQTLGPFGKMKPSLKSKTDVEFLWKNLKYIDVIESDHAPHTIGEKIKDVPGVNKILFGVTKVKGSRQRGLRSQREAQDLEGALAGMKLLAGPQTPSGIPGLETTLPLLLTATSENRLTIEDIKRLCFENPAKIFKIKTDPDTKIEVDLDASYTIENKNLFTKCAWSPFNKWKMQGRVERVFIRGTKVFEDGKILVKPGFGKTIVPENNLTL